MLGTGGGFTAGAVDFGCVEEGLLSVVLADVVPCPVAPVLPVVLVLVLVVPVLVVVVLVAAGGAVVAVLAFVVPVAPTAALVAALPVLVVPLEPPQDASAKLADKITNEASTAGIRTRDLICSMKLLCGSG